ncbi:MAG: hypothetical protein C5B43_04830 [Verrucomicrobia bacterium]|nr:MAG: hypothetical protein C5B43_04830 [Verrucomicrobiota bacterium]
MKMLLGLILAFYCFLVTSIYGYIPNKIIVFGDSLSDIGNIDRYTNGAVWLEVLAEKCELPKLECSKLGGTNFAYGGAKSGENEGLEILDVGNQIKNYLIQRNGKADNDVLYVIWVGGNDFLAKRSPLDVINNIRGHMELLASAGAEKFLIPNLPSLTYAPRGAELVQGIVNYFLEYLPKSFETALLALTNRLLYIVTDFYNVKLKQMASRLELTKNIRVYYLDTFDLFNQMWQNLETFGFKEKTELFYDPLHPSAKAHAVIADAAYEVLLKE